MTMLSTLSSLFPGPSLPSPWSLVISTNSPTESFVSNALRVTAGAGGGYHYYEAGPYDLTDSAVNWFRCRHDGTTNGFWEVTLSMSVNGASQTVYVYANGSTLATNNGTGTYDPVAHAWVGLKWVSSSQLDVFTAPDSSGAHGTATLLTSINYAGVSATSATSVWVDIALGTISTSPAYGELLAVNATVPGASAPTITLTPATATVNYTQGASAPAAGSVAISNSGTGTLDTLSVGSITFA